MPNNPWSNISWNNTIANCDKGHSVVIGSGKNKRTVPFGSSAYVAYINRNNGKSQHPVGLTFDCLPDPFSGDINSNVYCLNMNPGKPDPDFCMSNDKCGLYEKYYKDMLCHLNPRNDLLFDGNNIVCNSVKYEASMTAISQNIKSFKAAPNSFSPRPHIGDVWQRETWKQLRKVLGRDPKIFGIEFFPYHSTSGFPFPKDLPSNYYRNYLIDNAMKAGKLIIIMRKADEWYKDPVIGSKLKAYLNKVFLKNTQRVWLSPGNFIIPNHLTMDQVLNMF